LAVVIKIENSLDSDRRQALLSELAGNTGECEVIIEQNGGARKVLYKSSKYKISPDRQLLRRLRNILGSDNIRLRRVKNNNR
jgi:hypothetical protein